MVNSPIKTLTEWSRDWLAAWNAHNVEQVVSYCAPVYEGNDVAQASSHHGPDGMRQYTQSYFQAFPDLELVEEDTLEQGNRLALSWLSRGTHQGILMNIPPTGCPTSVRGVSILTIEGGLLLRALYLWDVAGLLREIGLLPDL